MADIGYNRARLRLIQEDFALRDNDQQFFDSFVLVIGTLAVIAIALFFVARNISRTTTGRLEYRDPLVQQEVEARIEPLGKVVLLGGAALKAAQAAATAAAAPKQAAVPLTGTQVFHMVCFACHASGAGGAPIVGNAKMWDPRIAKGLNVLEQHALNGFQGSSGVMPAKGGRPDLSDKEVISAVHYMVGQVDPNAVKNAGGSAAVK